MRDNTDVVARAKADLEARGVPLNTPCGAHEIVKAVVWELRNDGAGFLAKTTGNNCDGRSVDVVFFRDGTWVDVLINSETENRPAWQIGAGKLDPSRWLPPIDPGGTPAPVAESTPAAAPVDGQGAALLTAAEQLVDGIEALTARHGAKLLTAAEQLVDGLEALTAAVESLDTRITALRNEGLRVRL